MPPCARTPRVRQTREENDSDMTGALDALTFVFGLIVGSFLNVVIYRVPRDESIVKPRSRCPSCGTEIRAHDNVPVLSWLILRGHCRDCHEPISIRYPAVELFTGLIFLAMAWRFGMTWELPAYLYLAAVGVALSMIDLDTKRLPDVIVKPSYVVAGLLLLAPAIADSDWHRYGKAWAGALVLYAFYFLLRLIHPPGMGLGDVKLAGLLGLYLAWLGWGVLVVGGFLAFGYGAIVGVVVLVVRRKDPTPAVRVAQSGGPTSDGAESEAAEAQAAKAARRARRRIPFGPFMVLGAWTAILWGQTLWNAYTGTFPSN
jgi:leader peptidase (prepilin peptidase) / N-methyltransferase